MRARGGGCSVGEGVPGEQPLGNLRCTTISVWVQLESDGLLGGDTGMVGKGGSCSGCEGGPGNGPCAICTMGTKVDWQDLGEAQRVPGKQTLCNLRHERNSWRGGGELGVGDREGERGVSGGVEFGERSPGEQPCATCGALKSNAVVQKGSCAGAQPLHTLHTLHNADPSSHEGGLACGARKNHL